MPTRTQCDSVDFGVTGNVGCVPMMKDPFHFMSAEDKKRLHDLATKAPIMEDLTEETDIPFLLKIITALLGQIPRDGE